MPRRCTVCAHPERDAIDAALVADRDGNRRIASQHGLSEIAVRRHRENHLPETLAKAAEAEEAARGDDLLTEMVDLHRRTLAVLAAAEQSKEHRLALGAIREARGNLDLRAKLEGKLRDGATVNLQMAGDVRELLGRVLRALEPYPEARLAVAAALDLGTADGPRP
ncbi:MAG TPA: hypothetical protein VFS40_16000 [Gemmatimonadales bacterium]|nr:hypothetical protein [Gemmatimonadales bacterium]